MKVTYDSDIVAVRYNRVLEKSKDWLLKFHRLDIFF